MEKAGKLLKTKENFGRLIVLIAYGHLAYDEQSSKSNHQVANKIDKMTAQRLRDDNVKIMVVRFGMGEKIDEFASTDTFRINVISMNKASEITKTISNIIFVNFPTGQNSEDKMKTGGSIPDYVVAIVVISILTLTAIVMSVVIYVFHPKKKTVEMPWNGAPASKEAEPKKMVPTRIGSHSYYFMEPRSTSSGAQLATREEIHGRSDLEFLAPQ